MRNCLKPIDEQLEFTLTTDIQVRLREIKRLKKVSKSALKKALYTLRRSSVPDASKKVADIMAIHDDTIREIIVAVSGLCSDVIQLGDTVDLSGFDKDDIAERYFTDGYLQCFRDIYRKFHELRGNL